PSTKRQIFEWCLGKMQTAWSGEPVSLHEDGSAAVTVRPLPVQQPHPPIWVAAFGPKALTQAGRLGLPYIASPIETFDLLKSNYRVFDNAVAEAGQVKPSARPIMRSIYLSDDNTKLKAVRRQLEQSKPPRGLETAPDIDEWAIVGDSAFVRDQVAKYREEIQPTHLIVTRLRLSAFENTDFKTSLEKIANIVS
ncbi:MAG: LLM class flavin-dependent oxidoreductase, partial [Pseudomonadota bacterium]